MRKLLVVLLLLVVMSCATEELEVPQPTAEMKPRVYLPSIRFRSPVFDSPKKCLKRALAPCEAPVVTYAWDYGVTAYTCEGVERVVYLDVPRVYESWIWQEDPPSPIYMIFNEPDLSHWQWGGVDELVDLAHQALEQWPEATPIGPCISGDVDWLIEWYQTYYHVYGKRYPTAAICGHCYGSAMGCIDKTQEYIDLAEGMGLPVWLTEYNVPPGLHTTIDQVVKNNACFTRFLEDSPAVERYCMWGGGIEGLYGYGVPANPVTGWQTTHFQFRMEDGTKEWRATEIGLGFAAEPPTWEQCIEWGLVRPGQKGG